MKAPPRSTRAPAWATASAVENNCSRDSTEQGPAITTTSLPPIVSAVGKFDHGIFRDGKLRPTSL